MTKADVAERLREIATLLELKGENPFKARAYTSAARTLESYEGDLGELVRRGGLGQLPGLGEALVDKITRLVLDGRLAYLDDLRASLPAGLVTLLELPGLGPRKVRALYDQLGLSSIEALAAACHAGQVAGLPGFGEKTQARILDSIQHRAAYARRHLWWEAWRVAEPLLARLRAAPGVARAEHAGSLRRRLETVGDLDFIVAADDAGPVMDVFCTAPGVREVTARGPTKASLRLEDGLQADLRVIPPGQFAFALHHFTGSKEHNVALRQRALARGLSLSEWGLVPLAPEGAASLPARDEEELFAALGLAWIPPELREGRNEIEQAAAGPFPRLVEAGDLRGAFHNHTTESDGQHSLEEMAAAAEARGWEYLGIADHSVSSVQARGLDAGRLLRQVERIRALNASGRFRVRLLAGSEVDILADGRLDFPTEVLAQLDYVVASVHSGSRADEAAMTARMTRALAQPGVAFLGHPTGRLLLQREPYAVDLAQVIAAASAHGVAIEINGNPRRLDLDWRWWPRAAAAGVLTAINPDAHEADGLDHVHAGLNCARKGGLGPAQVINTWPLPEVESWLARRRAQA